MYSGQDRGYKSTYIEVTNLQAMQAITNFNMAFDGVVFDTRREYNQAKNILKSTQQINYDALKVEHGYNMGYQKTIEDTFIQQETSKVYHEQGKLAQVADKIFTPEQYQHFIEGLANLDRISANLFNKHPTIDGYKVDPDKWQIIQDTRYMQGADSNSVLSKEKWLSRFDKGLIKKLTEKLIKGYKIPEFFINERYLKLEKIQSRLSILSDVLSAVLDVFNSQLQLLPRQTEALFSWGDILKNPIGVVARVMGGFNTLLTSYYMMDNQMLQGVGSIQNSILKVKTGGDKDEDVSPMKSIITSITTIFVNVISSFANAMTHIITSAVTSFTSQIKSLMSLLKDIQATSPMLKAILEYLNLAMTMFFLPFFTSLGEPVLEALMGIIAEVVEFGINWGRDFSKSILTSDEMNQKWVEISEGIKTVLLKLMTDFVPQALSLVQPLLDFIKAFIEVFNKNSETILALLNTGVETYSQLINGSFIQTIISLGKTVFNWVIQNAELIKSTTQCLLDALRQAFGVVTFTMNNVKFVINVVLTLFGQIAGALVAYRAMLVATALTLGVQQIGIPAGVVIGFGVGQAQGTALAQFIISQFIDPIGIDGLQDLIPHFAKGGKIRKTTGGMYGLMAESNQGEYAIPESKLKLFRGDNNLIIRVNGSVYDTKALERAMKELELECPITIISN